MFSAFRKAFFPGELLEGRELYSPTAAIFRPDASGLPSDIRR